MRKDISSLLLVLVVAAVASGQPGTISTYTGGGPVAGPAISMNMPSLRGLAVTVNGDVYVASTDWHAVYKLAGGIAVLIAGTPGARGFSGDGGPATSASLESPIGVAVDGSGNLYIAEWGNNRIRKVSSTTGVITTVAGNGSSEYSGDGGLATDASLNSPNGVTVDGGGNLYIADTENNRIRKVSAETGVITTVAGNGCQYNCDIGDGGPATSASLSVISGVAVDGSGNLYIAEWGNNRIRKVSADTGVITTVAGNGCQYNCDIGGGGLATNTALNRPGGVAVDGSGNLYIADTGSDRIRKVSTATGVITTVAGGGDEGDGGLATDASLNSPNGVAVDGSGNLYIADTWNSRIRKVSASTGVITTLAGNGSYGFSGDGGPATSASLYYPSGVAVDGSGNLYIADTSNSRIRKVSADTGVITTVAGKRQLRFRRRRRPGHQRQSESGLSRRRRGGGRQREPLYRGYRKQSNPQGVR
ncbi:MAG: NHL repeat-containing protein [Bryobacteraceae bacterium]